MIKSLLFLAALVAVALSEPLTKPHPDCPADGHFLLPHEYLCTKFYYCERGERFIEPRSCAAGTEFSFEMQVCIFPFLANCNLPGFPPTDAPPTIPPTTQPPTTQPPTTQPPTTQPPTTQPPTTQPPTTQPPTTQPPTTQPPTTQPPTTQPPTTQPPTTQAPITQPPTLPPTQPPTQAPTQGTTDCERFENGCPVDFTIDQFIEHETSCRIFYRCVFGERVQQRCGRGTVFNINIPGCDHPGSIDRVCFDEDSDEIDDPVSENIIFLPNGCPADHRVWFLPHDRYCNVFWQCVNGETLWSVCAAGTHFNPISRQCDHIHNVNCRLPGGNYVLTTVAPVPTPTTIRPILRPNGCPVDSSIHWLVPHENCNWFYTCDHGNLILQQCPGGLHFNPNLQICDNPATAGCANGPCAGNVVCSSTGAPQTLPPVTVTIGTTAVPVPVTTSAPVPITTSAPVPVTTPAPVTATTPTPVPVTTPVPVPVTNATTTAPVPMTTLPPFGPNGCPTNHSIHWLLPHANCSKFYYCVYGNLVERECPSGLHFNPNLQICDHPDVAGCYNGTIIGNNTTPAPIAPIAPIAPTTQAPIVPTTGNGTLNDPDDDDDCPDRTVEDRICEEECHVLPWAHEDCDKFWVCYDNKARLVTCSNGLYFNPAINSCDFACNVDCVSLKVRMTPHNEGLQMYIPWHKLDNQAKQLLKLINEN